MQGQERDTEIKKSMNNKKQNTWTLWVLQDRRKMRWRRGSDVENAEFGNQRKKIDVNCVIVTRKCDRGQNWKDF